MPGKNKNNTPQAKLHKTKSAAPKKSSVDALSKLVTTCNAQIQEIHALIREGDTMLGEKQCHSTLKSRVNATAQALSCIKEESRTAAQMLLREVERMKRKLEDSRRISNDNNSDLDEIITKMQGTLEEALASLEAGGRKKKRTNRGRLAGGRGRN